MAENIELEDEVTEALRAGAKISAIKKLRETRGIGLKEAKELVDTYCEQNNIVQNSSGGTGIFSIIIIAIACYFTYRYFA